MLSGRTFDDREVLATTAETSVMVSQSLARQLFGDQDAVGPTLLMPEYQQAPHEVRIVGVTPDVRFNNLTDEPPHVVYRPLPRQGMTFPVLLVRFVTGPLAARRQ